MLIKKEQKDFVKSMDKSHKTRRQLANTGHDTGHGDGKSNDNDNSGHDDEYAS